MALDTEHGFKEWFARQYAEYANDSGIADPDDFRGPGYGDFTIESLEAAYEAGVKWKEVIVK